MNMNELHAIFLKIDLKITPQYNNYKPIQHINTNNNDHPRQVLHLRQRHRQQI